MVWSSCRLIAVYPAEITYWRNCCSPPTLRLYVYERPELRETADRFQSLAFNFNLRRQLRGSNV